MLEAGFDFTQIDQWAYLIGQILAIYFAVRKGTEHGNGGTGR